MYIYLDESGDLGFSEKSSNYFVITLLLVKEPKEVKNCIKKIRHKKLKTDEGLQAVDFISWSIFRNYEWKDSKFYDLIKEKITIKKELF